MNTEGITKAELEAWVSRFGALLVEHREHLSDLDASSGDADHGENMVRGFADIADVMASWATDVDPGGFLRSVGLHTVDSVGGSSGALYGTFFLRMARVIGDTKIIDAALLVAAFSEAQEGIAERGKVQVGDKTMLDALAPAVATMGDRLGAQSLTGIFAKAADAAAQGCTDTAAMVARRGKSSYARERSRGVADPGASSMALLIRAAAEAFREREDNNTARHQTT